MLRRAPSVHLSMRCDAKLVADLDAYVARCRATDDRLSRTEVVERIIRDHLRAAEALSQDGGRPQRAARSA